MHQVDGTLVTMDGYLDPTEDKIDIKFYKRITNRKRCSYILVGAEMIDTENENYRYNTFGLQPAMIMRYLMSQTNEFWN